MIACVYCGGTHARPADVRRCWAEQQVPVPVGEQPGAPVEAASVPATLAVTAANVPAGGVPRRGPESLGRNVIVGLDDPTPSDWAGCERVRVTGAQAQLAAEVERLQVARHAAHSLVIELCGPVELGVHEQTSAEPHEVGPELRLLGDELAHLVWSNSVDWRDPSAPAFAPIVRAIALGASPVAGSTGDVVLADGTPAWIDAGPLRVFDQLAGCAVLHAVAIEHGSLRPPDPGRAATAALAPDQLAAVTHPGGGARIIAPAGSGKTRVLTERARHLLTAWRLPAGAVSLVAFNKRAQQEMRARTVDLGRVEVRTLNSIALAVVNGNAPFAAQPRQWRTIDEPEVRSILQRFVQMPRKLNVDPLAVWIDALSLVRLGLVDPLEVERRYGGDVGGLAEIYPQFVATLERQGAVDFDDQIRRALLVLLRQPAARAAAQRACRLLLVDEFQDLTPAHLLLVRLLSGGGGSVFAVGDDDQTIYGYNGADPTWLIDFADWFPGSGDHPLEVNYRCPAEIVDVADRLLRHNRRRVPKTIRAAAAAGVGGYRVDPSTDPVAATVTAVAAAIDAGATPAEVAVLTRVNATLAPVQIALGARSIAVSGGVGTEFVERTAIRSGLAWLRLSLGGALAGDDLHEALRRPSRSLHPRVREWVAEQRSVDALTRLADRITNDKDAARLADLVADITRLRELVTAGATTERLARALIDEIGLGGALATLDGGRHGMNRAAQSDDLTALVHLARLQPDPHRFESWLREGLMVRRHPDGVTLATVHRVKGQEWRSVVVHLAADDQFPHRLAEDHEEERRLFHVAITRAARHLTLVTGTRPSPFVAELTTEPSRDVVEPASPPVSRRATASTLSLPSASAARGTAGVAGGEAHPLLDRQRVMAVVGLVLVDQGQEWPIVALEPAAAVCQRNGTVRKFSLGEKVETAGRQRGALGARNGAVSDAAVRLYDRLRLFRERARGDKPAYTVFDDATLAAIAAAVPADLADLARIKGVGPVKLERYGDELLDLAAASLDP